MVADGAENDARPKKPLACRLGLHSVYGNTTGVNIGSESTPIYVMQTEKRCNHCDWASPC